MRNFLALAALAAAILTCAPAHAAGGPYTPDAQGVADYQADTYPQLSGAKTDLDSIQSQTSHLPGALGQQTKAGSLAVTLPSDPDYRPSSGAITAADVASGAASGQSGSILVAGTPTAGSYVAWALNGHSSATVTVTGTFSATAQGEASYDSGVTWVVRGSSLIGATTNLVPQAITAPGVFQYDLVGATNFRIRATAYVSGTMTVQLAATAGPGITKMLNAAGIIDRTTGNQLGINPAGQIGVQPSGLTLSATPTIQVASYTAGNCMGGFQPFAFGTSATVLSQVSLASKSGLATSKAVYLFHTTPSASTCNDKAAFVLDPSDVSKILKVITLTPSANAGSTITIDFASNLGLGLPAGGTITAAIVETTTETPGSTTGLVLSANAY